MKRSTRKVRRGFSLVEIMIVVSIIALLAVIALPSFLRAREQARAAKFMNALRVASGVRSIPVAGRLGSEAVK